MESGKSTENLAPRSSNDGNGKAYLVLIVFSLVIAIVSLVVACIAIGRGGDTNVSIPGLSSSSSGSGSSSAYSGDNRIWSIAIGHQGDRKAYLDDASGTLKGFHIDFVNAVCSIGNKNCRIVYDIWSRCWDSQSGEVSRGGTGLMSGWYDACAGWVGTYERYRTYAFTLPYGKLDPETLYVKPGSPLKSGWEDMTGRKIGVIDGWSTDEFCLLRNQDKFTGGVPFTEDQIVHYQFPAELTDAVINGEVDYAFAFTKTHTGVNLERVDGDPVLPCAVHGNSVMTRKINQEYLDWWNPAQQRLMDSSEYERLCQDLEDEHGHQPGQSPEEYCIL